MEEQILKEILQEMKGFRQDLSQTNSKLEGLFQSFVVLQQFFSDMRRDIHGIKEILAEKVIWQNDNVTIESKEGIVAEGIIRHLSRK